MSGLWLFIYWFTGLAAVVLIAFGIKGYRQGRPEERQKPLLMILAGVVTLLNLVMWSTMQAPPPAGG